MIVNHPYDIAEYVGRRTWGTEHRVDAAELADQIYKEGTAAGLAPSQDWGVYLQEWEKAGWKKPKTTGSSGTTPTPDQIAAFLKTDEGRQYLPNPTDSPATGDGR